MAKSGTNLPLLGFLTLLLSSPVHVQDPNSNSLSPDLAENARKYIADHYESPSDYLVRQFATHDIIFLGEMHGVRQNLTFFRNWFLGSMQRAFTISAMNSPSQGRVED